MQLAEGPKTSFMVYPDNKGGILNPENKIFYSYSMIYANGDNVNHFRPSVKKVVIDGVPYEDAIRSTKGLVIDQNLFNCRYPIGTPFPDEITTRDKQSIGNIQNKCFTKKEFVTFYSEELGKPVPTINDRDQGNTITDIYAQSVPQAEFGNAAIQTEAQKITTLLQDFVAADDADVQKSMQKKYHELTMALVAAYGQEAVNQSVAENEKYNQFVTEAGQLMGAGVLLK